MRYLNIFAVFFFSIVSAHAQTDKQIALVEYFVFSEGASIIGGWAHPLHKVKTFSVDNFRHTYYIKIGYDDQDRFYCTYTLYLSESGEIKDFIATDCNSPYSWFNPCFDFCNTIKDNLIAKWAENEDNSNLTRLIGKSITEFTCKDCCFVRLYQLWHSDGFYRNY